MGGTAERVDLLIGGGGMAGLSLAVAVRQALGGAVAVTVADPALAAPAPDARASAIVAAGRRLFGAIGVWPAIAAAAQPIRDMVVTDSHLEDAVRPTFLRFDEELEPGEPFAHMIENGPLIEALLGEARALGVGLRPAAVASFSTSDLRAAVELTDGLRIDARLLVAADGARSRLRERAGIATIGWSYGQSAIVTTVRHERDHGGRAVEHFLPGGPFAILPLQGRRSSIVWTEPSAQADDLVALPQEPFLAELERRFGLELGAIAVEGPRQCFPLGLMLARAFVAERFALIGDAAHVIHPIAGQGLNIGLKDVAALAECVVDALRLGLDPGGADTLARYQQWRRFDTAMMAATTDALNRLFSNRSELLRAVRDLGLGLVERMPSLKHLFIREAAGLTGTVPKLLRGQAL